MAVSSTTRALLFWGVCIPLRTWLTIQARKGEQAWLRLFAFGVGSSWLTGNQIGNEGVFGGPAFWADDRPIHGLLWSAYAISDNWQFLALDTAYGAANWVVAKI